MCVCVAGVVVERGWLGASLYRHLSLYLASHGRSCGTPTIFEKSCPLGVFTWKSLGLARGQSVAEGGMAMGTDPGISRTHYQSNFFRDEKRLHQTVIHLPLLSLSTLSRALALRSESSFLLVCERGGLSGRQQTWPGQSGGPHLTPAPLFVQTWNQWPHKCN